LLLPVLFPLRLLLLLLKAFEKPLKAERDAAAARHGMAIKRLQAEKHLYVTDVSTRAVV
jgi:hypothetical protein